MPNPSPKQSANFCRDCGDVLPADARSQNALVRCVQCGRLQTAGGMLPAATAAGTRSALLRQHALNRVRRSSTMLHASGALFILGAVGAFVYTARRFAKMPTDLDAPFIGALVVILGLIALGIAPMMFVAGVRMPQFRSHRFVQNAAMTSVLIGLMCYPLALVAVWPLLVIIDPRVRTCFEQSSEKRRR